MAQDSGPQEILADDRIFREKLGIGEDAYKVLRLRKKLSIVLGVAGAGAAGVLVASSSAVATTFFPKSGFLATFGLGAPAETPLGWVVAAAALAGGAYLGAKKLSDKLEGALMHKFPKQLNKGPDELARELLKQMLPLSLKFAKIGDDQITTSEGKAICDYYAEEWGYTRAFVEEAMKKAGKSTLNKRYKALGESLVGFCNDNEDCNRDAIVGSFRKHLKDIIQEEENSDRREEKMIALEYLEGQFQKLKKTTTAGPSQPPQP